ncbi:MAG TPA: hypothetical protein VGE74_13790 [Gemmata sp.]
MRHWRKLAACSFLGLFAAGAHLALGHAAAGPEPAPLTVEQEEAFSQVRAGMTRDQVETLLGLPRDSFGGVVASLDGPAYRARGYASWVGLESELLVLFDDGNVVTDVRRVAVFWVGRRSWLDRTLSRLGL